MKQNDMKKHNYGVLISLIGAYVFYTLICLLLKSNPATTTYAGILLTTGDTILNILIVCIAFSLWKNSKSDAKRPFGFFVLSFAFVTIPNALYQILFNVFQFHTPYFSLETIQLKVHHYLYTVCLVLEFAAWLSISSNIFSKSVNNKNQKGLFVTIIVAAFLALFVFKSGLVSSPASQNLFEGYVTSFYIINFILAMLCLAVCKNKGLFYLSLGYLIIVGADLIMEFGFMSQYLGSGSIFDTSWFLGLLFVFYGFWHFKKSDDYKLPISTWVSKPTSIKTQTAVWSFILCSASLAMFLAANIFFTNTGLFF